MTDRTPPAPRPARSPSRIPVGSFLDGRGVPMLLGGLALILVVIVAVAVGVVLGWIPFT